MVERCVRDAEVASSNLVASILFLAVFWLNAGIAQSVEHFTRNEGVVSSSLISSSTQSLISFRRKRGQAFFRAGKVRGLAKRGACTIDLPCFLWHNIRIGKVGIV